MLEGATNFRDLGGMETADGRRIRLGMLYRSNSFARLTPADIVMVERLGLRTIVDLRSVAERRKSPSLWTSTSATILSSPKADTADMLSPIIAMGEGDEGQWRARFSGFFAEIPRLYAQEYGQMFRALAAGGLPMLVNCSAGKDRTGVAILLILTMIGVPPESALADYLLSGERLNGDAAFVDMLTGNVLHGFADLPLAGRQVMLGVHESHARAALSAIAQDHGSVEAYVIEQSGLTRTDIDRIRDDLTIAA
jgi:protein-tyrosine phosphatase